MKLLAGFGILVGFVLLLVFAFAFWMESVDSNMSPSAKAIDVMTKLCTILALAGLVCSALIIAGVIR